MPICRRSGTDMRTPPFAAAFGLVLAPAPQPAGAQTIGAKAKIEAEGSAAAEQVKRAMAAQRQDRRPDVTVTPAPLPSDLRRRAFDALQRRGQMPAMEARARAAASSGRAVLATERDAMAKKLGQALGLEAPDMQALAKGAVPSHSSGWVPVLFVSSSMPVATLRTYAGQLERAHGVLAFRGMPGGLNKVAPMAKLSAQILRLDPGCVGPACAMRDVQLIVDPIVFRQHGIARVPALAMIPGDPTQPYCEREEDASRAAHIVYGDAALTGLLDEYARLGGKEEVLDAQARMGFR